MEETSTHQHSTDELDPFSAENAPKLNLVVSMRIYDVLMALLMDQDEDTAKKLHSLHSSGQVLFSLPWLDMSSDEN